MSEALAIIENKEKNWLSALLKLIFILSAFVLVGITVLANMGGSNESLKSSVESFVSSSFQNRPTTVDRLNNMSFFPRIGFDAEGINVLSKPENGYKIVEIGRVQVFMGFWNVAMRKPRVTQFYIKDFRAIKGAMGPKEFYIDKIFIDHDTENGTAKLRGNGEIGDNTWSFNIVINAIGSKNKYTYTLSRNAPFEFNLADISLKGAFINHEAGYFKFQDTKVTYKDIDINGDVVLSALGKQMLKLKSDIKSQDGQNTNLDLIFDYANSPVKIEGSMSSQNNIGTDNVLEIILRFREIVGYNDNIEGVDYDLSTLFDFSSVEIIEQPSQVQE